jgi:aryl-phospho-beta-D-glucosidase BglC (GH1 family)
VAINLELKIGIALMLKKTGLLLLISMCILSVAQGAWAQCIKSSKNLISPVFGLQLFYPSEESSWALVKDLGIKWVRIELRWDNVEPEKGKYVWEAAQNILNHARISGIHVMLLINHPPEWAMQSASPAGEFESFLHQLFARYPDDLAKINYFEILNEPNNPGYGWNITSLSLERNANLFADFLKSANLAIRSIRSDAVLVSGGLSPDGLDPYSYWTAVFSQGSPDCVDIIGYHPYGAEGRLVKTQNTISHHLESIGVFGKPVWFTEYGTDRNSDRERLIKATFAEKQNLNAIFWFADRDINRWQNRYGLVTYDGEKKPEYPLFKQMLNSPDAIQR